MPNFDLEALRARQAAARAEATATAHPDHDRPPHLDPTAIAHCQLCDDDGYRHTTVCDHREHTETARRGMQTIRQTMGWNT